MGEQTRQQVIIQRSKAMLTVDEERASLGVLHQLGEIHIGLVGAENLVCAGQHGLRVLAVAQLNLHKRTTQQDFSINAELLYTRRAS